MRGRKNYFLVLYSDDAVCIALEAEVAETEVIRAPERLQRAREKRGQLPFTIFTLLASQSAIEQSRRRAGQRRETP